VDAPARNPSALALTVLALLHYKPLHVYGMQQLIKQWGKDKVVNVGQRANLHRTIERLRIDGLLRVQQTIRDRGYPERTVYEITASGREAAHDWMLAMLATPKAEYPQFPAALSHLLLLTPHEARDALGSRADELARRRAVIQADLDTYQEQFGRVSMLESEHMLILAAAEEEWVRGLLDDIDAGQLSWAGVVTDASARRRRQRGTPARRRTR
jgi:DNA-binding PadR family transcriptional regulator